MTGQKRVGRAALLTVLVLTAAFATPSASQGAVTIGSNLQDPANVGFTCATPCTVGLASLVPALQAPGGVTSPINGVVVRWRVSTDDTAQATKFRIIRQPGMPDLATGAGTSAEVTPTVSTVTTFPVQLPIAAGDFIGLDYTGGEGKYFRQPANANDAVRHEWDPALIDGEAPKDPDNVNPFQQVMINADIEPDCDGDTLGDETQDPLLTGPACPLTAAPTGTGAPGVASLVGGSAKLKKNTVPLQITCAAGATCVGDVALQTVKPVASAAPSAVGAKKTIVQLGTASFSIPAAGIGTVSVNLSKRGRKIFKQRAKVAAQATLTTRGAATTSSTVAAISIKKQRKRRSR